MVGLVYMMFSCILRPKLRWKSSDFWVPIFLPSCFASFVTQAVDIPSQLSARLLLAILHDHFHIMIHQVKISKEKWTFFHAYLRFQFFCDFRLKNNFLGCRLVGPLDRNSTEIIFVAVICAERYKFNYSGIVTWLAIAAAAFFFIFHLGIATPPTWSDSVLLISI